MKWSDVDRNVSNGNGGGAGEGEEMEFRLDDVF